MNKHEATELGIRLVAILNLSTLISSVPALLSVIDLGINTNSSVPYNPWVTLVFGIITPLIISLLLWFNANAISTWLWRKNRTTEAGKLPSATQIQIVLFSSVGLYLLLSALPDVFKFLVYLVQKMAGHSTFISLSDYALAIGYIIQVIISIWLIFDSDGIVRGLQGRKSRNAK